MEWALTFAAFVIGSVFGYVGHSVLSRNSKDKSQNKQLEQTQLEFSQYKQEVSDHCDDHDKQLAELTNLITKVNQKWHTSANVLTAVPADKPHTDAESAESSNPSYTEKAASV
ncbi:ZapG family protein [Shewanella sp. 10N.286.54.B9]|uniref:ZapG family protein n=1 Tax=Shewanella sp. 10N.286.54.B9 TaxID=3229719 RepID=UPI00354D8B48